MFEEITPEELQRHRDNGELWQLLDVRETWELETACIAGSINIPMSEIPERLAELDASRPLAVMCHSGGRSARVAGFLADQGFVRIANLSGGIDVWSQTVDSSIPRY